MRTARPFELRFKEGLLRARERVKGAVEALSILSRRAALKAKKHLSSAKSADHVRIERDSQWYLISETSPTIKLLGEV